MKEILNESVNKLKLDKKIAKQLIEKEIDTIFKLCNYSRLELNDLGFINTQINDIIVSLQLIGLDIKKNHAKKNKALDNFMKS